MGGRNKPRNSRRYDGLTREKETTEACVETELIEVVWRRRRREGKSGEAEIDSYDDFSKPRRFPSSINYHSAPYDFTLYCTLTYSPPPPPPMLRYASFALLCLAVGINFYFNQPPMPHSTSSSTRRTQFYLFGNPIQHVSNTP